MKLRHSFLGASLCFLNMSFERYSASNIGFAGQTGLSFDQNNINIRLYLSGEYAKAIDNTNYRNFELNYSGIRLIGELNFNLF
ncbi:MAG: hypothetical protein IPJ45_02485 [Ignavibacteria bacterium]|nr:hypothetical protein [Ignavibacteria bacterium]